MSNYTPTTVFASLTGTTILGSPFDVEYGNIATAIASKYDSSTTTITLTGAFTAGTVSTGNVTVTSSTIPTNGMYLGAANQLNFSTNGVSRFTILSTGGSQFAAPTSGGNVSIVGLAGQSALTVTTGTSLFSLLASGNANTAAASYVGPAGGNSSSNGILQVNAGGNSARAITFLANGKSALVSLNWDSNAWYSTGATTPVLTGNKPAGGGTAIQAWITVDLGGTIGYMPVWQ